MSLKGIQHVMEIFAAHFNKNRDWLSIMERSWAAVLLKDGINDKLLIDAMHNMCAKHYDYPHQVNLSNYIQEIEMLVKKSGGTGLTGNQYEYCEDCEHSSGIVMACVYYVKDGEEKIREFGTACTCTGATAKFKNMKSWRVVLESYKQAHDSGKIELVSFYKTDKNMVRLPYSITNPAHHKQVQEQIEREYNEGIENPYLTAVATMVTASGIQLDERGQIVGSVYRRPTQPTQRTI